MNIIRKRPEPKGENHVVEAALKRDFVRRAVQRAAALDKMRPPVWDSAQPSEIEPVRVHEHAFARRKTGPLIDNTLESAPNFTSWQLRPSFVEQRHTHPGIARPSLPDMMGAVLDNLIARPGRVHSIHVVDNAAAERRFQQTSDGLWRTYRLPGKSERISEASKAARRAASELTTTGIVEMVPTKRLLTLSARDRMSLMKTAMRANKDYLAIRSDRRINMPLKQAMLSALETGVLNRIEQDHGHILDINPYYERGHRFDPGSWRFVKEKGQ